MNAKEAYLLSINNLDVHLTESEKAELSMIEEKIYSEASKGKYTARFKDVTNSVMNVLIKKGFIINDKRTTWLNYWNEDGWNMVNVYWNHANY